jgi:serine/threonine protein kinase
VTDSFERLKTAVADRYTIERELGAGGMATVYLAHDVKHDRRVAVKVLRPELAAVLGAKRFLNEIKVTANLQHPHILPLHDSGEAGGFVYYVMPYVEGESLRAKLEREKELSIEEAIEITKAVASALDYAHRQDVIHRDIKPENILLHDGQPVVADFGIALAVSAADGTRLTETGLSLGTPQYMSPEQAMGDRELDGRSDIYSLACIMYEMLVGEAPYTGPTAQAILTKIVTEEPKPVTQTRNTVPEHVDVAIRKALAKLPADRFATAAELVEAIVQQRAVALPTSARRRWWAWAIPAAMLAMAAIAIATLVGREDGRSGELQPVVPVQLTANPLEMSVSGSAISPDGRYLAFVDLRGLHLQDSATKATRSIPIENPITPWKVWWYPNKDEVLFLGTDSTDIQSLWSISMFGGSARKVHSSVMTAAIAPDGEALAVIRGANTRDQSFREIWLMGPNGENPRLFVTAGPEESFWKISWTPDGAYLAVAIWSGTATRPNTRIDLVSIADGHRRALMSDEKIFQAWTGPLPLAWCGASRLLFSRRDGPWHQATSNVWMVDVDLTNAQPKGEARRLTQWTGANVRELSATRDCSRVVVLQVRNQADVYVGELDRSGAMFSVAPHKLTFDEREDIPADWSAEGLGLLLLSSRAGTYGVYHKSLGSDDLDFLHNIEGDWVRVTYAPGGNSVLYRQEGDIWTVPSRGGAARLLAEGDFEDVQCVPAVDGPCVAGTIEGSQYVFYALDPNSGATLEVARTEHRAPFTQFDLSPDGTRVAVVHNDDDRIVILDLATGDESFVVVHGWSMFEFVSWKAQSDGFFVNSGFAMASGYPLLLSVDMDGRARVLRRNTSEWYVYPEASPDGRHLAFASMSFHGNAWLIEGF